MLSRLFHLLIPLAIFLTLELIGDTLGGHRPWSSWPFAPIVTTILCLLFYIPFILRRKVNLFNRLSFLCIFLFYLAQAYLLFTLTSTLFGVQPLSNHIAKNIIISKDFIDSFGEYVVLMIVVWIVAFFATISCKILYLPQSKSLGSLFSAISNILMWIAIMFVLLRLISSYPSYDSGYGKAIYLK